MKFFYQDEVSEGLGSPVDSQTIHNKEWVEENYPREIRYELMIVEADNILEPSILVTVSINLVFSVIHGGRFQCIRMVP